MNRREFLKKAGIAAGFAILPSGLWVPKAQPWNIAIHGSPQPAATGGGGYDCGAGNLGYDTAYASLDGAWGGYVLAHRIPFGCAGVVASITWRLKYCESSSKEVLFGLYADNGSGTAPGALIYEAAAAEYFSGTSSADIWCTHTIPGGQEILGSPTYIWTAVGLESGDTQQRYQSGSSVFAYKTQTFGSLPSPYGTPGGTESSRDYSTYVTTSQ